MTSSLTDAGAALSTMFNKGTLSRGENLRNSMDTESQPPGRKPTGKVDSMILLLDIDMQVQEPNSASEWKGKVAPMG